MCIYGPEVVFWDRVFGAGIGRQIMDAGLESTELTTRSPTLARHIDKDKYVSYWKKNIVRIGKLLQIHA